MPFLFIVLAMLISAGELSALSLMSFQTGLYLGALVAIVALGVLAKPEKKP